MVSTVKIQIKYYGVLMYGVFIVQIVLKRSVTCEKDLAEDLKKVPLSAQGFEAGLQKIAPFTWDLCHRFKPMS